MEKKVKQEMSRTAEQKIPDRNFRVVKGVVLQPGKPGPVEQ